MSTVCLFIEDLVCVLPFKGGVLHGGKGLYLRVSNVTVFLLMALSNSSVFSLSGEGRAT